MLNMPFEPIDYVNYFSFLVLVFTFYGRLKSFILNFDELNPDLKLEKAEDLNWEKICMMISLVLKKTYNASFNDILPAQLKMISFPQASRRYMFKRAFQHVHDHLGTWNFLAGTVVGGTVGGFGVYYVKTTEIDSNEKVALTKIESDERVEMAKLEEAKAARIAELEEARAARILKSGEHRDEILLKANPSLVSNPRKFNEVREVYDQGNLVLTEYKKNVKVDFSNEVVPCSLESSFFHIFF